MMKEATIKRINKIVVNYLSIMGLWEEKKLDEKNPVVIYFMTNILINKPKDANNNGLVFAVEGSLQEVNNFMTLDIPQKFFHMMVKEFYDTYEKLDVINNNQNEEIKQTLIQFIGNEQSFKEYINSIMHQYKEAFYDLIRNYNSLNPEYNNIKIKILSDKMGECVVEEDYIQAAQIRDKIKSIKEKGK